MITIEEGSLKSISIKVPDMILTIVDNIVRLDIYDSRSDFLRKAIEDLLNSEFGKWEEVLADVSKK